MTAAAAPGRTVVTVDPRAPTIVIRREFAAPRALVFEAYTRPEHLREWWGPESLRMIACTVDLRAGGGYRFVLLDTADNEYAWHGTYREIVAPERLVQTEVFEGAPEAEALETVVFEERDGRTTVTSTLVHRSLEARDAHVAAGMEAGVVETFARLDVLLARPR